ncbi:MAG: GvpL/GvpF family gas vesicle protein [Lentisphaerota bacterium]
MSSGNYIYLYCVTKEEPNLERRGALEDELYLIPASGLYACVSNVPEDEFGEENLEKNLHDLEWLKKNVERHEKTIEGIMKDTSVIPFKLATVFFNEQNVQAFLAKYADGMGEKLDYVKNKQEWGVKIYCDPEKLKQSTLLESEKLREIDRQINSASPGKAYLLGKKKNELVAAELDEAMVRYRKTFLALLEGFCFKSSILETTPRKVTGRNDDMILNAAFLVEKSMVPQFISQFETLESEPEFAAKGFCFSSTGPWAPYNFCQLTER